MHVWLGLHSVHVFTPQKKKQTTHTLLAITHSKKSSPKVQLQSQQALGASESGATLRANRVVLFPVPGTLLFRNGTLLQREIWEDEVCVVGEGGLQNITAHQVLHNASNTRALSTTGTSRLFAFNCPPQSFHCKRDEYSAWDVSRKKHFLTAQSRDNVQSDHPRFLSLSRIAHSGIVREKHPVIHTCSVGSLLPLFGNSSNKRTAMTVSPINCTRERVPTRMTASQSRGRGEVRINTRRSRSNLEMKLRPTKGTKVRNN